MTTDTATETSKVLNLLEKFINARPRLDPADYGMARGQTPDRKQWFQNYRAMRGDQNTIRKDGTRARKLLEKARIYPENWPALEEAFRRAFSGRLSYKDGELEYCTGQYYPTEYRAAAAAVLECYVHEVRPKFTPPRGKIFTNAAEIKAASKAAGSHYFEPSTMRFFRSRVLPSVFHGPGGCFFVTSEQYTGSTHTEPRKYTVRKFNVETADVDTVGDFNTKSRTQAIREARELSGV
jgi:hypothetical protein